MISTYNNFSENVRTNTLIKIVIDHFLNAQYDFDFSTFTTIFQNPKSITKLLTANTDSTILYNECVIENGNIAVRETPTVLHSSNIHRGAIVRCILVLDRMHRIYGDETLNRMLESDNKCHKFLCLFKKVNSKINENIEIERLLYSAFEILRIYNIAKTFEPNISLSELSSLKKCYSIAKHAQKNGYNTMYFASLPSHSFNEFDLSDYSFSIQQSESDPDLTYHKNAVLMLINAVDEAYNLVGEDLMFETCIEDGQISRALSSIKDFIAH